MFVSLHIFESFCVKFCGFHLGENLPPPLVTLGFKLMAGVVISLTGTGSHQRVTGIENRSLVYDSGQHTSHSTLNSH